MKQFQIFNLLGASLVLILSSSVLGQVPGTSKNTIFVGAIKTNSKSTKPVSTADRPVKKSDKLSGYYIGQAERVAPSTDAPLQLKGGGLKKDLGGTGGYGITVVPNAARRTNTYLEDVYYYFYPDGRVGRGSSPELECDNGPASSNCGKLINADTIVFKSNGVAETHRIRYRPNGFTLDDSIEFARVNVPKRTAKQSEGGRDQPKNTAIDGTYYSVAVEPYSKESILPYTEIKRTLTLRADGTLQEVVSRQIVGSTYFGAEPPPRTETCKGTYRLVDRRGEFLYSSGPCKRARFIIPPQYMAFFPPELLQLDTYEFKLRE